MSFDTKPFEKNFGDVIQAPDPSYSNGETVTVKFWGGHPNNNFQTQSTYLVVEKKVDGRWQVIAMDWDPSTVFQWKRIGFSMSEITVEWIIPEGTESGVYRICHHGHWRRAGTGEISPYTGISDSFTIQ